MPEMLASSESETRFQYEVIRSLSDSVRQTVAAVGDLRNEISEDRKAQQEDRKAQNTVNTQILERLARIESNRVNEEVAAWGAKHEALNGRVDKLESSHDYDAGMRGARKAVMYYWPAFAALAAFVLLLLMATGIVVLPETQKAPVVVPVSTHP